MSIGDEPTTHPEEPAFNREQAAKVDPILQYFDYAHLPQKLQRVSKPFADLAYLVAEIVPRTAERTVAFRKLLEAKDAAVRAALPTRV